MSQDLSIVGLLLLAGATLAYGVANLLQAVAAGRQRLRTRFSFSLIASLVTTRLYVLGSVAQTTAFLLAFAARRDLPLFLVQAGTAGAVGVTTLMGVLLFRWRLRPTEVAILGGLAVGLVVLVGAAAGGAARDLSTLGVVVLGALLVVFAVGGWWAARAPGARGAILLSGIAGMCFGAGAVAARTLADTSPLWLIGLDPVAYILLAHLLLGQALMAPALQRGATTAAVATMQATALVPTAIVGVTLLGDQTVPGRGPWVFVGLGLVLLAVVALTVTAQEQHPTAPTEQPARRERRRPSAR